MSADQPRPMGVTILAAIALVAGVADIAAGLGNVGIGGGFLTDHGFGKTLDQVMTIVGLALAAVGVLGVATGVGLLQERNWAWLLTRLWASLCIVVGLVSAGLSLLGDTVTSGILATILGGLVPAIAAVVVLWYIYRPDVRAAFGRA
jgi:hypothetical protein